MELTRRNMLAISSGALVASGLGAIPAFAATAEDMIAEFTGGAAVGEGELSLTAPEIAENGNTVPIEVSAPGAVAVAIYADGNPTPAVATVKFGKLNPSNTVSTRIRLAGTQNVVAVAQMEDGSFQQASAAVKVTIGGCGG
ncbi:thiosulfate oxidation carrier protein SoxY [Aliishimia ponticola]|uniref:Thiosulfate oxidation carrier protein SoxY n=1 Tax=Aliishimia ponticola TaxID=2499833 RepID=A0A4S4NEQ5_9RHOB|nr:thiosulfate oxidation carrier protein SoxY [Aliishimia ponticola]THH38024.1 thiosulfate oxidation carrier protein SoxY [Aliishimia ponticola]